jgi:hypothetical protein
MQKIFLILTLLFLFSCKNAGNSKNSSTDIKKGSVKETFPVKELIIGNAEEEGWGGDVRLSINSISETDTSKLLKALSTYQGKNVGFLISIPNKKEGDKGFASGILLKSIGTESDNLLQFLSKLYKQKSDTSLKFTNSVSLTYVNLNEFAKSLGAQEGGDYKTENQYKLFYEGNNEKEYAELYLNYNLKENWVELKEKDEEYRPMIIKFLKK